MTPFSIMRGLTRTQISHYSRMPIAPSVPVFRQKILTLKVHCKNSFNCFIILLIFCIVSLCLILLYARRVACTYVSCWDNVCVAMYDIIVLTSRLILVFLQHALCHVITSCVCRHDWQYYVYTVQCTVISNMIIFTQCVLPSYLILLYLHHAFWIHIWYYCTYTMHCTLISDIIVLTPCIVP
jgi:uncharacterized Tic20 family protein